MNVVKKRRKLKVKNLIAIIIFLVSFILITISIIFLIKWQIAGNKTKKLETNILEITEIIETEDTENVEIIEQPKEIEKSNPYWDYIKMKLISVNFTELKKINNNIKGWIQVNGTNINYPFVQTDNNEYYLKHTIDDSYNTNGWVFLDYRNNISKLDKNTIIYAHGNINGTMFGSLKNILESGWYNNINNHVIKIATETENTLWQVFSVYHIPTTNDYIQTEFLSNNEFLELTKTLKERSYYSFDTEVTENDKILTLSTCWNETEKVVLHAKLIKKELTTNLE